MTGPCDVGVIAPLDRDRLVDLARSRDRAVVLIDGRSGSGKTTLARELAGRLGCGEPRATLVSLDDCYPGWHGLAAASSLVPGMICGEAPGYRRYDWTAERLAEWVPIDPRSPLIIEGCGAITPASAALAGVSIWVCRDEPGRRRAAAARDGDVDSWWRDWAAQEQAHLDADRPQDLADVIADVGRGIAWTSARASRAVADQVDGTLQDGLAQVPQRRARSVRLAAD